MANKPTPEQQKAIDHPHSRSAIISAAAGSGKTTLLVERIVRLLSDMELSVSADSLVVVTFTRNAAASLRVKLNNRLSAAIDSISESDPKTAAYLSEQLIKLRSASIGTINSFCLGILKENAQLFGLPMNFTIADSAKLFTLQETALRHTMAEFYSSFSDEERDSLFYTFNFENDAELQELIISTHEKLSSYPDRGEKIKRYISAFDSVESLTNAFIDIYLTHIRTELDRAACFLPQLKKIEGVYRDFCENEAMLLDGLKDDTLEKFDEVLQSFTDYCNECDDNIDALQSDLDKLCAAPDFDGLENFVLNAANRQNSTIISSKYTRLDGDITTSMRQQFNYYKKLIDGIISGISQLEICRASEEETLPQQRMVVSSFLRLAELFNENFRLAKDSAGVLDFADCELMLADMLRKNEDFRSQLSQRYSCIFIDEFQDSNDLQAEIFKLLSNGKDNLFYVGDVKQAIYGFRGGNPKIMADMLLSDEFACYTLSRNFRSRQPVIDFANAAFCHLMTQRYGDVDYSRAGLVCGAGDILPVPENPEDYLTEMHLLNLPKTDSEEDISEYGDMRQARFVANRIKQLVDEGFMVSDGGEMRKCRYSDFAVLLRKNKAMKCYSQALAELNIPAIVPKGRDFLCTDEITLVMNLLRVVDNPMADSEMLSVLMSPVYGMTAQELAELRLGVLGLPLDRLTDEDITALSDCGKNQPLYSRVGYCTRQPAEGRRTISPDEEETPYLNALLARNACEDRLIANGISREVNPKLRRFRDDLEAFRRCMSSSSIEELIRKVYDDTDLVGIISAMENSRQHIANIRLLLKYAADYEASEGRTLSDFIRFIDRTKKHSRSIEEATPSNDYSEAVKIMSFHGSKGLEMPICIVAELDSKVSLQDCTGTALLNVERGIAMKYVNRRERFRCDTFAHKAIELANREKIYGEELRLLYVALTRAQEKLIIVGGFSMEPEKVAMIDKKAETALVGWSPCRWLVSSLLRNCTDTSGGILDVYSECDLVFDEDAGVTPDTDTRRIAGRIILHELPLDSVEEQENDPQGEPNEGHDEQETQQHETKLTIEQQERAAKIFKVMQRTYHNIAEAGRQAKFSVTELAHKDEQTAEQSVFSINALPPLNISAEPTGFEVGDIYHHTMEHIDLELILRVQGDYLPAVEQEVERMRRTGLMTEREDTILRDYPLIRDRLCENVARFFAGELGQQMLNCFPNIEREYRIYRHIEGSRLGLDHDSRVILEGRADMFFYDDDGIVLVDYKSDTLQNLLAEKESYAKQLAIYRTVLPLATGRQVKRMCLYSFSQGTAIDI